MGIRGELFTTQIQLENRSYFFNVKENRTGDIFLQIVESKNREGTDYDRHQVAIFSEDMREFLQGLDKALSFVEKARKAQAKAKAAKEAAKQDKVIYRKKNNAAKEPPVKRTGKVIRIASKKKSADE